MTSDNVTLIIIEALCTLFLIIGIYTMIYISSEIEFTIKKIDSLREENKSKNQVNIQMGNIL